MTKKYNESLSKELMKRLWLAVLILVVKKALNNYSTTR